MIGKIDKTEIEWPPDMSEKARNALRDVLRAFDDAAGELDTDPTVIYSSETERLRRFFLNQENWTKLWSRPNRCMYEGCTAKSISRSHSIPMSASLKLISEAGHVVTPRLGENGVDMNRVGIRQASTFPGFCQRHESLFTEFETTKKMSSDRHYILQTYRTLCRERFRMHHQRERLKSALNEYQHLRRRFIIARVQNVHNTRFPNVMNITFENDKIENHAAKAIESLSQDLSILYRMHGDLIYDIQNGTNNSSLIVRNFDLQLPVCLSGLGVLSYMQNGTIKRALCILAILPEEHETKAIIGTTKEHTDALDFHCADETSPTFLANMESWMCHGSDHWFMTPSSWNAIPELRQKVILKRILDSELSIADPVDFSILDGPRKHIIDLIEQAYSRGDFPTTQFPQIHQLLAREKKKFDDFSSN